MILVEEYKNYTNDPTGEKGGDKRATLYCSSNNISYSTSKLTPCLFSQTDEFYNCYKSLPEELVKIYGSDIKLLHIHDNRGVKDEHYFPFTGNVNGKALIEALEHTGYKGVYNFEVNPNKFGKDIVCDFVAFLAKVVKQLVG